MRFLMNKAAFGYSVKVSESKILETQQGQVFDSIDCSDFSSSLPYHCHDMATKPFTTMCLGSKRERMKPAFFFTHICNFIYSRG